MENRVSEVEAYMKSEAFSGRGKRIKKEVEVKEQNRKIPIDERDRVLNKVRQFFETGKGERLNEAEEEILKEIAGVYFSAYKKAIEILDNKKLGGIENER